MADQDSHTPEELDEIERINAENELFANALEQLALTTGDDNNLVRRKLRAARSHVQAFVDVDLSDARSIPAAIEEAILRVTADLYNSRGDASSPVDDGWLSLVEPWRKWVF